MKRESMVPVVLLAVMGVTASALSDAQQANSQTQQQPQAENRDGRWLRAGIREYQRFNNKAADQTLAETSRAVSTVLYIRGVMDALWSAAFKARVQEMLLSAARNSTDPKVKLDPKTLEAMHGSSNYFAPLWKTDFVDSGFQIDQYIQMISNYLDAHPEKWDKHAQDIIEAALVTALPKKTE